MAYRGYVWDGETGALKSVPVELPLEVQLELHVNGETRACLACSPSDLKALALGFLYTEGLIKELDDVEEIYINRPQSCADVWLKAWGREGDRAKRFSAECAEGEAMAWNFEPPTLMEMDGTLSLMQLEKMKNTLLQRNAKSDPSVFCVSGLFTAQGELLVVMQDWGSSNTVYKIAGYCLLKKIALAGRVLLSSGGISSEMVTRVARLGIPIIGGRLVTSRAIALATAWGLTTLGYGEGREIMIYTHPERLVGS